MNRIDGKIAVITGGTQGLGAAIARQFAEAGAVGIAIIGRDADKGAKKAKEITDATAVPVEMITADLANIHEVQSIIPSAVARFGTIDILVNAAGLTDRGNILNTAPELFDAIFAVNVRAPFFLMQDSVKQLEKDGKGGRIINIGSVSARTGQPFLAAYSASKGALETLTRNAGYGLMRNRVHVNQLNIGWMASDHERKLQLAESGDPDWEKKANATLAFGRLLDPKEVARAVLFLASDDAGMMTGSVIHFDQSVWGGYDGQPPGPAEKLKE